MTMIYHMRILLALFMVLLICGCLTGQAGQQPKIDDGKDARIKSLFADLLGDGKDSQSIVETTTTLEANVESTTTTLLEESTSTTVSTTSSTTTQSTSTTTTITQDIECSKIPNPMSKLDCERGYCPMTGYKCGFLPGNMQRLGKCTCMLKN